MLLDNKNHGKVIDQLKLNMSRGSKLSVLSGLFSIYGYSVLKRELSGLSEARILLSKWDDGFLQSLAGQISELRIKNHLNQARIAKIGRAHV